MNKGGMKRRRGEEERVGVEKKEGEGGGRRRRKKKKEKEFYVKCREIIFNIIVIEKFFNFWKGDNLGIRGILDVKWVGFKKGNFLYYSMIKILNRLSKKREVY